MKVILRLTIAVILIGSTVRLYGLTGEEAVLKFQQRMNAINTISGTISWMQKSGENYTGNFKYMGPGKIYIKFINPSGRILASNGKKLYIFDSSSNICGVQELDKTNPASGGIVGIIYGYKATLAAQGPSGYTIKFENTERAYPEIILTLDASFLLKKAILTDKEGEVFSIMLSNLQIGEKMAPGTFDFNVPPNAQVVKNPLDIK